VEIMQAVSRRVFLTLPDGVADDLDKWAAAENNKAATLAGFIVEQAVRQAKEQGKIPLTPAPTYKSISELITKNLDILTDYNRIDQSRLDALAKGDGFTELEIARLALALGLAESYVEQLAGVSK
jgi:CopG-like RHH_1 or ribbon-helix-helix domain, RHH_5